MSATLPDSHRPKRRFRWFRYSLRTLMLFVTACALACSWLAVKLKEAKRQHKAVEAIQKAGGQVHYDYQLDASGKEIAGAKPHTPVWLRNLIDEDLFDNVVKITAWRDKQLQHIKDFPDLQSLDFYCGIDVTDNGMANLQYVPELCELRFGSSQSQVTEAGLAYIRPLARLRHLELRGVPINDAGLQCLDGLTALEDLSLEGNITDAGLPNFYGLTQLQHVDISATDVSATGVHDLQQALPNCKIDWAGGTTIEGSIRQQRSRSTP